MMYAAETGYRVSSVAWKPRFSVRFDMASGDTDAANAALQSFDPLFPGNAYSGAVGLFGPTNLTDLTPSLTVTPRPGLVLGVEAPSYWRTSTGDGVYSTDLRSSRIRSWPRGSVSIPSRRAIAFETDATPGPREGS